jgi:hypothetical protein
MHYQVGVQYSVIHEGLVQPSARSVHARLNSAALAMWVTASG